MKSYREILVGCAVAVFAASAEVVSSALIFHASFEGSAAAVRAKGEKEPCRAEGLAFAEGKFGQAVRLTAQAKSVLEYRAKGNLVPERGTASLWFKGAEPDEWIHAAMSWDASGVWFHRDGKRCPDARGDQFPLEIARAPAETFRVGKRDAADGFVDDLRIYSAPLSDEQVREIWRRGQVIEITVRGCPAIADEPSTLTVSATSPGGCDLSGLKYCICDSSGKVLARYRHPVGPREANLLVHLPPGDYTLKTTDGTWFYGAVPCTVVRRNTVDASKSPLRISETNQAKPMRGLVRAWHDFQHFDAKRLSERQKRMDREEEETPIGK